MVALFQSDSRGDAFAFNSGSTVSFDVVTRTSPNQNSFIHQQESAADFANLFRDSQIGNVSQPSAALAATQVQAGLPSNGTTFGK